MANLSDIIHGGGATGARVLITSSTASASASIDFTSGIDSTYNIYEVEFIDVLPATDGVEFFMRVSTDAGSTYKSGASDYSNVVYALNSADNRGTLKGMSTYNSMNLNTAGASYGIGNTGLDGGVSGNLFFYSPDSGTLDFKMIFSVCYGGSVNEMVQSLGTGVYETATAVDAVQFLFDSGNITSGEINLYGITP